MRDFFKSKKFKALAAVCLVLVGFMIYAATSDGYAGVPGQILSTVAYPFQKIGAAVTSAADGLFTWIGGINYLWDENDRLTKENEELRQQMVDYEELQRQNAQYEALLGIKEQNQEILSMEAAFVIGRDAYDRYGSFTIDKGSADGIAPGDPVITAEGLVGTVSEVTLHSAKVSTTLDISVNVGVMVSSTRDTGVICGDLSLSEEGLTKLMYLDRSSHAKEGDMLITTGVSGIFPKGLIVGTIREIHTESHGKSLYAVVEPVESMTAVKDVFVITSFEGELER